MSYNVRFGPVSVAAASLLIAVLLFLLAVAVSMSVYAAIAWVLCWAIGLLWHPVPFLPVFAIVFVLGLLFSRSS